MRDEVVKLLFGFMFLRKYCIVIEIDCNLNKNK